MDMYPVYVYPAGLDIPGGTYDYILIDTELGWCPGIAGEREIRVYTHPNLNTGTYQTSDCVNLGHTVGTEALREHRTQDVPIRIAFHRVQEPDTREARSQTGCLFDDLSHHTGRNSHVFLQDVLRYRYKPSSRGRMSAPLTHRMALTCAQYTLNGKDITADRSNSYEGKSWNQRIRNHR